MPKFVTIKIHENVFEQLKEYRDENNLKSITGVIQNSLDCLHSQKIIEEQKRKMEYYKLQETIIEKLIEATILNWGETAKEGKKVESIEKAISSFKKIEYQILNDPEYSIFKNNKETLYEIFLQYIRIIIDTLCKTEIKEETKNKISDILLKEWLKYISKV